MLQWLEVDNEKQTSFLLGVQLAVQLKVVALVDILHFDSSSLAAFLENIILNGTGPFSYEVRFWCICNDDFNCTNDDFTAKCIVSRFGKDYKMHDETANRKVPNKDT